MPTAIDRPRTRAKLAKRTAHRNAAAPEMRALRSGYGLSQALLARLLDVSLRTISGAESAAAIPAPLRRNFTQISRLCQALGDAMDNDFVGPWLDQPNDMLNGLKPVEAIERGQLDLVWQVVEGLRSGSPL